MTFCLCFDGPEYAGEVATAKGWADFCRWVDSLPLTEYETLTHFCEHGWALLADGLADQLREALAGAENLPRGVRSTGKGLLQLLALAGDSRGAYITDQPSGAWLEIGAVE
jgi:hypothetical protein